MITPDAPVYVLCGCRETPDLAVWPASGPIEARSWAPDASPIGGLLGLLWGAGDPGSADMDTALWAVVKVDAYVEIGDPARGAVKFQRGEVVFRGIRPEAVDKMVSLGAPAFAMATAVSVTAEHSAASVTDWGVAEAGDFGAAVAGDHGWARAGVGGVAKTGFNGFSRVAARGVAVADEAGEAAAGEDGVAVSDGKRYGSADTGDFGVSVGRGRFKLATTGDHGVAVAGVGGRAKAGSSGVAVCKFDEAMVERNGVAVGELVSGGPGSLLVAVKWDGDAELFRYATGMVGEAGVEPYARYRYADGVLVRADPG